MTESIVNNSDSKEPNKVDVYEEFIIWSAMPPSERVKIGIETQEQFVEFYKIGINTPANWKKRPDFKSRVKQLRKDWAFGKVSAVLEGIYRGALKGNPQSQKLFLQICGEMPDNKKQEEPTPVEQSETIGSLINSLPEPLKEKYTEFVRDLIIDTNSLKKGKMDLIEVSIIIYNEDKEAIRKFRETDPHSDSGAFYL